MLALVLLASAYSSHAATFTVTNLADSGEGSLRQAIIDANTQSGPHTIDFNLPNCPCTITLATGELEIAANVTLTIAGPGADQLTIARDLAATNFRIFDIIAGATVNISGITITGGRLSSPGNLRGAGIRNFGSLTLVPSVVVDNSDITTNTVCGPFGCTPSRVGEGGGIFNGSVLVVRESFFVGNNANNNGGAIRSNNGTTTIESSAFSANTSNGGGAIHAGPGTLNVANSTFSGNSSTGNGGAITNNPLTTSTIRNSTIVQNSASASGGGIANFSGTVVLKNGIVSNNTAGSSGGPNIHNFSVVPEDRNLIGIEPLLGPLADNGGPTLTHALLAGSPAVNAGDDTLALDASGNPLINDQRGNGFARIAGGAVDIGAFEVQPSGVVCPLPQGYWKNNPGAWPVEELTLGTEIYTKAELLVILNTPVGKGRAGADASVILAYQLIAAKLNIANGADGTAVIGTIAAADALLSGLDDRLPYAVRPASTNGKFMTGYAGTLDVFNNGTLTAGCSQ